MLLMKIDNLGNLIWFRTYEDFFTGFSLLELENGNIAVLGEKFNKLALSFVDSTGIFISQSLIDNSTPSYTNKVQSWRDSLVLVNTCFDDNSVLITFDTSGTLLDEFNVAMEASTSESVITINKEDNLVFFEVGTNGSDRRTFSLYEISEDKLTCGERIIL